MWVFGNRQFRHESGVLSVEINEYESSQNQCANETVSSKRGRSTCVIESKLKKKNYIKKKKRIYR